MTALRRARKRFGQHFLEPAWVAKLLASLSPAPDDVFLEIGPGRGALTIPLAARVRRVIAVEIDRDLAGFLQQQLPPTVTVVQADFLEVNVNRDAMPIGQRVAEPSRRSFQPEELEPRGVKAVRPRLNISRNIRDLLADSPDLLLEIGR